MARMPAVFISHGAPTAVLETGAYAQALIKFGQTIIPKAIVIVSAHWEYNNRSTNVLINTRPQPDLMYDFGGFPPEMYRIQYPAVSDDAVSDTVKTLLTEHGIKYATDSRQFDHGVWVPLKLMYPAANVPIIQLSVPMHDSVNIMYKCGVALSGLRDSGVMLMGSGGVVHNLGRLEFDAEAPLPWASEFDDWVSKKLVSRDIQNLLDYEHKAPQESKRLSVPTSEHFDPLFFALGAGVGYERVEDIFTGFLAGTLSLRCFTLN